MATVHIFAQAKGSIGKTMSACILTQYLINHCHQAVQCLDLDEANCSLSSFQEFPVQSATVRDFEAACLNLPEQTRLVVIDVASAGFFPFCEHLYEKAGPTLLAAGHSLILHPVVTGGGLALETFNGVKTLADNFPDLPLVVWLNPYFGKVSLQDGKTFEESKVYRDHAAQFAAFIKTPETDANTLGRDLAELFANHISFEVGINSGSIMVRARLKRYYDKIIEQLEQAGICAL